MATWPRAVASAIRGTEARDRTMTQTRGPTTTASTSTGIACGAGPPPAWCADDPSSDDHQRRDGSTQEAHAAGFTLGHDGERSGAAMGRVAPVEWLEAVAASPDPAPWSWAPARTAT